MKVRLTQVSAAALKAYAGKPLWVTDAGMANLKLYVGTSGAKVWYFYYYGADGKKASLKLGPLDKLTVAQARELAREVGGRIIRARLTGCPVDVKPKKSVPKPIYGAFLRELYEPWVIANRRRGSLCAMRWGDVDFATKTVPLRGG